MRQYLCECSACKNQYTLWFDQEPFPILGDSFPRQCLNCGKATPFQRVATRKARSELRAIEEERALREAISAECRRRGFTCTFLYQSVVNANQGLKAREGGRKTAQKSRECKYVANKSHNTLLRCLRQQQHNRSGNATSKQQFPSPIHG